MLGYGMGAPSVASAQMPNAAGETFPATARAATAPSDTTAPSAAPAGPPPRGPKPPAPNTAGIVIPLRVGVAVFPVAGISARSLMIGGGHYLDDGGFVPIDIAPGYSLTQHLALELAVSALIPVQDAYGFPAFRLALMPGFRFDSEWVYSRLGVQFMFGDDTQYAVQLSLGANPWQSLYVGVLGFASTDLIVGLGPEVGFRFDELTFVTNQ